MRTLDQQIRLNTVLNFIGCGNPLSSVWIMGREEAGQWSNSNEEIRKFSNISFTFENELEAPGTYTNYRKILEFVYPVNYQNREYFITNLFPFGMPSNANKDLSIETKEFFGFNIENNLARIYEEILPYRYQCLLTFFKSYNWNNKTIFFSSGMNYNDPKEELKCFIEQLYCSEFTNLNFQSDPSVNNFLFDESRTKFITQQMGWYNVDPMIEFLLGE